MEPAPPEVLSQADAETRDASVSLDEETQKFISQSLTDVDLFASYGLTQKAIGLLEAILRRAPRHTPTIEKLLDFVLGAGDDRRTAELASRLEQLHAERGDQRSAERFAELRRRFQRAAGLSDAETGGRFRGRSYSSVRALRPIPVMISLILKNLPLSKSRRNLWLRKSLLPSLLWSPGHPIPLG